MKLLDFSKTEQEQNPTAVIQALEALDKKLCNIAEKKYLMDTESVNSAEAESDDSGFESRSSPTVSEALDSSGTGNNDAYSLERVPEGAEVKATKPNRPVSVTASVAGAAQVCYCLFGPLTMARLVQTRKAGRRG
jgi:hypothetical protein